MRKAGRKARNSMHHNAKKRFLQRVRRKIRTGNFQDYDHNPRQILNAYRALRQTVEFGNPVIGDLFE